MTELFLSLLGISLSVSLVIVLLLLVSPLLNRRYAAKWKYLIWIFLAARLLFPWGGVNGRPVTDVLRQWRNHMAAQERQDESSPASPAPAPGRVVVEIPAQMTTPLALQTEKNITLLDVGALIWAAGCFLFISLHLISYLHYKRQVIQKGTIVKNVHILQQLLKIKRELHIGRRVPVMEFGGAASPMILGFFRPVLVLPDTDFSEEEMFFILKHELVHLKRGDVYWKLLFMAANGAHWFNPLVWIMRKEAGVDMELSCDEKVTQGADLAVKQAYTETLLSTLHNRCGRRTDLSTGLYGGKKIMKKRFRNILTKKGKKNGAAILACIVILTVSAGTLVGCSVGREEQENTSGDQAESLQSAGASVGEDSAAENGVVGEDAAAGGNETAENGGLEETVILSVMKEGEAEEKQASLVVEDGYILYLPDGEWQKEEADTWQAVVNENVRIRVAGYESGYPLEQILTEDGYAPDEEGLSKLEDDISYQARLYEAQDAVWLVEYSYPMEAEEGWGRELPIIADTFAVLMPGETITDTFAVSTQVLGYISGFGNGTVTVDRQDWVTPDSADWKPEYDADAGFEVVDLEGRDVTYPVRSDCRYHILENHQGESMEISEEAFQAYLRETDFPIFWGMELEEGEVVNIIEWYRP